MRSSSESNTHKFVMNDGQGQQPDKELIVNLVKLPWKNKANNNVLPGANSHVIDLTSSMDSNTSRQTSITEKSQPCNSNLTPDRTIGIDVSHSQEFSDVIDSSVLETSHVDADGFRMPLPANRRKRQSKTLLLKAGKLWRRSLSIFKRSTLMVNLMNEGTCVAREGNYCICTKCNLARQSMELTRRRCSIRVVPASPAIDPQKEVSVLENYAHTTNILINT
ncbi:hypothetical protein NQ318_006836 [Aromia moschata]|uniref:Uncharacterized protein n=1 Tax=Aromia moschata TaxID=1265417 RepID=A0AAV8XR15_9CUCU|nr:hypothetical protein NQ318_006836 [Aromia moschata]